METYSYYSDGRRPSTAITVIAIWGLLGAALVWLDASILIIAILAAFTLPALYDLIANPRATFTIDETHLRWSTPRQQADIALGEIDHLRFDTRLDMSVRLTVVRPSGVKIRLPYPATPPHAVVERVANQAGLKTHRHHFSLMG